MAHKINFIFIKLFILLIWISASISSNNFLVEATVTWDYILLNIDKYLLLNMHDILIYVTKLNMICNPLLDVKRDMYLLPNLIMYLSTYKFMSHIALIVQVHTSLVPLLCHLSLSLSLSKRD